MKSVQQRLHCELASRGLDWLLPDWPAPANVSALMTTRSGPGGGAFDVSTRDGSNPAAKSGRDYLQALCGRPIVWLNQVHGREVVCPQNAQSFPAADALILDRYCLAGAVQTADCLPALFCNRAGTRVAAAHAGWRGLCSGVLEATVARLDSPPQELLVWLGAAIGPQAYEVGKEVREAFCEADAAAASCFRPGPGDRYWADLYALARLRLGKAGVEAVYGGDRCTYSEPDSFYSHRRSQEKGRMAAMIWISSPGRV